MSEYHIVRGTGIEWSIKFFDSKRNPVSPANATLYVSYKQNGERIRQSIPMVGGLNGEWIAEWDSSVADAGFVYWHARCSGDSLAATEGRFVLLANPANPDPT